MQRIAAALAAAAVLVAAPASAQQSADPAARVAAFAKLPYWPGFWVSEQ